MSLIRYDFIHVFAPDLCRDKQDKFQYAHKGNCQAYYECVDGYSEVHCCPDGMSFFGYKYGCMASSKEECNAKCPPYKETNEEHLWQGKMLIPSTYKRKCHWRYMASKIRDQQNTGLVFLSVCPVRKKWSIHITHISIASFTNSSFTDLCP